LSRLHGGFQVRQYRPWKIWLGLVLVIACLVLAFILGHYYQSYELQRVLLERETLISRIDEMESRNRRLVQENAHLEGGSKIEREAYQLANQELVKLQQELLAQKEELVFYQGIVSPSKAALGVNLQSFEVRRKNNQNEYSYKLILTKSGKSTRKVSGNTELLIRGESGGNVSDLKLVDLVLEESDKNTKFAFRYFQVFEGDIVLPEGFEPFEVKIGIKPTTKKVEAFSETISWTEVLSEGV
jgi:cell division protein FtsL